MTEFRLSKFLNILGHDESIKFEENITTVVLDYYEVSRSDVKRFYPYCLNQLISKIILAMSENKKINSLQLQLAHLPVFEQILQNLINLDFSHVTYIDITWYGKKCDVQQNKRYLALLNDALKTNTQITTLSISFDNALFYVYNDELIKLFRTICSNSYIISLFITLLYYDDRSHNNNYGKFLETLSAYSNLKNLYLRGFNLEFNYREFIKILSANSKTLTKLSLIDCALSDELFNTNFIQILKHIRLTELELSENNFSTKSASHITQILANNKQLRYFGIARNSDFKNGQILEFLADNPHIPLYTLSIGSYSIRLASLSKKLFKAVKNNKHLDTVFVYDNDDCSTFGLDEEVGDQLNQNLLNKYKFELCNLQHQKQYDLFECQLIPRIISFLDFKFDGYSDWRMGNDCNKKYKS